MNKILSKLICFLMLPALMFSIQSCKDKAPGPNDPSLGRPLIEFNNIRLGWGKGRENGPGYLSVNNGQVRTFMEVAVNDRSTQEKIDIVFPGDWGSSGGLLTIAAPSSTGAGAAAWEYCRDWTRKKSTLLTYTKNSFDMTAFERITHESQLLEIEKEQRIFYSDWVAGSDIQEGRSFIFKTEEGHIGIAFIHSVNGTYGSTNANVTLSIKLIPQN